MRRFASFFLVMMLFTAGVIMTQGAINPTIAYADDANASISNAINNVQNSSGGVIGSETTDKVNKLGKDSETLVLSFVVAVMTCTTIITALKFHGVGDNSQAKSILKGALIGQIGGIVFLASCIGFIQFGVKNFNLFGG
ncbi:hypothetical protein [uncultured Clostridium sp.]|uniref:hypothetical protein n=1 Tax=uncultured Clostridium sp. TaxID=59620 RepID=UPI0028EF6CBE|nr:hypothetical protein [uncultured Clostridium sp.]